jgi:hypothetical protein
MFVAVIVAKTDTDMEGIAAKIFGVVILVPSILLFPWCRSKEDVDLGKLRSLVSRCMPVCGRAAEAQQQLRPNTPSSHQPSVGQFESHRPSFNRSIGGQGVAEGGRRGPSWQPDRAEQGVAEGGRRGPTWQHGHLEQEQGMAGGGLEGRAAGLY